MEWSVSLFNPGSNGNIDIWLELKILLGILENLPNILDIKDCTLHGGQIQIQHICICPLKLKGMIRENMSP